jgi:hypothetical protein
LVAPTARHWVKLLRSPETLSHTKPPPIAERDLRPGELNRSMMDAKRPQRAYDETSRWLMQDSVNRDDARRHPPIEIINKWWRKRLQSKDSGGQRIDALHDEFVRSALTRIKNILGIGDKDLPLVTVRLSFCASKKYIRPVYSEPPELTTFFRDPNHQKPFELEEENGTFNGIEMFSPRDANEKLAPAMSFAAWYRLDCDTSNLTGFFSKRIKDFVQSIKDSHREELNTRIANAKHCFFAGRTKEQRSSSGSYEEKQSNDCIQVSHMLAIYYQHAAADGLSEANVDELRAHAEQLFLGLDLIARIDAMLFQSEGLELVSDLMPEFARNDVAHADKIAYALEQLRTLFTRHMIGRHGGGESGREPEQGGSEQQTGNLLGPDIFYLAATFEKHKDGTATPRLELYPHVYRTQPKYYKVSFLVSHRSIPTATKFLLWRYMTSIRIAAIASGALHAPNKYEIELVELNHSYGNLFELRLREHSKDVSPERDFLLLTENENSDFWSALQKHANEGTRSLAAFVVEGKAVEGKAVEGKAATHDASDREQDATRYLPRGIFAIESPYEDGFSDDDTDSLRTIFQGVASLIRSISHHHAPVDYRSQIATTFQPSSGRPEPDTKYALTLFLFYTQKLDAYVYKSLVEHSLDGLLKDSSISFNDEQKELLRLIARSIDGAKHIPSPDERSKILSKRMSAIRQMLHDNKALVTRDLLLSEEVLQFLDACPENFTWASYFRCMAQTLGERMKPHGPMPQFLRLKPGFSATGMFMANVVGELRQVVKLSTAEKIDQEADRYRKWVRFRLVNAARIPSNAVDFETTGHHGKVSGEECGEKQQKRIDVTFETVMAEADGILVSDLVSGEDDESTKIRTLLDTVVHCIDPKQKSKNEEGKSSLPGRRVLEGALAAVFVKNAALWSDPGEEERKKYRQKQGQIFDTPNSKDGIDGISEIERGFRFDKSDSVGIFQRLQKLTSWPKGETLNYDELIECWSGRELAAEDLGKTWRIVHGDMNARNLTWSDALKTFFLIDFEFTQPGLVACDQMRLIANLIAETWFAFGDKHSHGFDKRTREGWFVAEMNHALNYLEAVFAELMHPQGSTSLSVVAELETRLDGLQRKQAQLASIFEVILKTIEATGKYGITQEWRSHWALILFIASVKEFSYTCRRSDDVSIDEELVRNVLEGTTIDDKELLATLAERVENALSEPNKDANERYYLLRHVLAGRLLAKLIAVLNVLKPIY